jgi:hypothetical protein
MPSRHHRHRHHRKKGLNYWLKKIFPFLNYKKKPRFRPIEEASPETRFLTIEEVKAAQAESKERELMGSGTIHTMSPEELERPSSPSIPLYVSRRRRSKKGLLRRILQKLSFRSFKKRYPSGSHDHYHYLTREDINQAKAGTEAGESGWLPPVDSVTLDFSDSERPSISEKKGRHKRRKRRKWLRALQFWKKAEKSGILINPADIREETEKAAYRLFLRPILNSTAVFLLTYQISWFLYQLAVMVVASFNKIDSVLYYYEVMFPIGNFSPKWSQINIIFITLAGPVISLIIAFLTRYLFLKRFHPGAQARLFFVWLYLNSVMLFLGSFVGGAITRQGFGYVVDWLYINIAFRILFSLIFLSLIIWVCWKIVGFLPEVSSKDSWKNNRNKYVLSRLVIPWLLGGIILVLLKITPVIPQHENIFTYDTLNIATLMFAVVPPLLNSKVRPHYIQGKKTYPRVHRSTIAYWFILAVLAILLIRVGLAGGIYFQMDISFNLRAYH